MLKNCFLVSYRNLILHKGFSFLNIAGLALGLTACLPADWLVRVRRAAVTGVAIFVGCLGLFGLATYAAERCKKEIGIRKVLGVSVGNIVSLLSKEFMVLVLVAAVIAFPAWLAMNAWLQDFAYRIDMPLWAFLAAGAIAAVVAFLTVGYQAVGAATVNPVNNLRAN